MNIFLTGATGFLGGELLVNLSKINDIDKIYCLVRAKTKEESVSRLKKIFTLHDDYFDDKKVIPIIGNLIDSELEKELIFNKTLNDINLIIHSAANTSFSPIYNEMVEKVNVFGLEKILKWSKSLKDLKTFLYIGTATICGEGIGKRVIYEEESPNLNSKHFVKYTFTKMQGEIMLRNYLPDEKILIARPSIIMGDSRTWIPRSYVILWALAAGNLMRLVPVDPNSNLDIVSVDYTVKAIIELIFAKRNHSTYHISSGSACSTTPLMLTKVFENLFTDRPPFKFVNIEMISQMKNWAKGRLQPKSSLYQYSEYLEYWNNIFENKQSLRILFAGLEPYLKFIQLGQIFDNSKLLKDTFIGNPEPAHEYIKRSAKYLENIDVFEGALDP